MQHLNEMKNIMIEAAIKDISCKRITNDYNNIILNSEKRRKN